MRPYTTTYYTAFCNTCGQIGKREPDKLMALYWGSAHFLDYMLRVRYTMTAGDSIRHECTIERID